jgi:tetratricopeptide (TPR) repeat protein
MPAWVLLNVVALLLLVVLGVRFYRSVAPFWHLPRGNFEEARKHFVWMTRSWFKTTRRTGVLGAATCDQFLGKYEDALAALRSLPYDDLDKAMKSAVDTGIGSALSSLERDPREVRERLSRAAAFGRYPEILLGIAHAELSLGRPEQAQQLYDEAMSMPPDGSIKLSSTGTGVLRFGAFVEQDINLQAGWFLARVGRGAEAIPLLEEAANWPIQSSMNDEARKRLAGLPRPATDDDEPPPISTAAVVMDSIPPRA